MSAAHKAPEFSIVVESSLDERLDPTDPVQFSQLVRLHHRELLVYARALCRDEHTARDIVQDSFVVAFDKVRAFDVTRDFGAWMRGIVRNKWREWVRSNRFVELPDVELASIDRDVAQWQESHLQGQGLVFEALALCMSLLPERLRQAIDAFYYREDRGGEAAEQLGVAPSALRKRLQRARELLRECVARKMAPPVTP
ncbi:MAG: sigma-70 family RNA polymerase sigma factor [Verrucomicrobiales bacterium]